MRLSGAQNSLNVRMDGQDRSRVIWGIYDPIESGGWGSAQTEMIRILLPHIRQFVRVRQALASAEARGAPLTDHLDNTRVGVIRLDRRGRILAANDRALDVLRQGDGLLDQGGFLRGGLPSDNARLDRLLTRALTPSGFPPTSGSMTIRRSPLLPRLTLYINPVSVSRLEFGARRIAALVLIVERQAPRGSIPNDGGKPGAKAGKKWDNGRAAPRQQHARHRRDDASE